MTFNRMTTRHWWWTVVGILSAISVFARAYPGVLIPILAVLGAFILFTAYLWCTDTALAYRRDFTAAHRKPRTFRMNNPDARHHPHAQVILVRPLLATLLRQGYYTLHPETLEKLMPNGFSPEYRDTMTSF